MSVNAAMLSFLAMGQWSRGQVNCRWTSGSFTPQAPVLQLIEQTWIEKQSQPGVQLFDGPMCRLESFAADPHGLELHLSRTSYKAFLGTNLHHAGRICRDFGPGALANPVGVSCALVSADGFLLLGRRNQRVAYYPGRIHPFAGALEPRDVVDVFSEARRELHEELAFTNDDIAAEACLGLIADHAILQPELVVLVRSTRPRDPIERQVDHTEHLAGVAVAPDAGAASAAVRDRLLTPVAVGTVLLWGRTLFGADWFNNLALPLSASGVAFATHEPERRP